MKTHIQRIALLLALIFCFTMIACSDGGTSADETTRTPSGDPEDTSGNPVEVFTRAADPLPDDLLSLDFGGETFTILSRAGTEYGVDQFTVEDLNSDPVNDAIYNRNIAVEDALNVEIKEIGEWYTEIILDVQKDVMSSDSNYDVVAGSVAYNTPQIDQGYFFNMYDNGIETYLDLDEPWWPQDWIEEAKMGEKLYCLTGPLAMTFRRFVYVFYYNKGIGADYNLENMYDVVNEGRWTVDYLNTVTKNIYRDLNGNSEVDEEDQFGLLMNYYDHMDIFWSCFDMRFLGKDEDGWFTMVADEDKISTAFDKAFTLVRENPGTWATNLAGGAVERIRQFANGQSLFCCEHLELAETEEMRNSTIDYGMLPQPKFDEAQKEYHSFSHDQYSVFMIPVTVKDPEMVGAVLQMLDYETYTKVEPAYFDQTLKGKYSNDPETRNMINIILDGMVEDACWIYGFNLGQPQVKCFRGPINDNERGFSSAFAKVKRAIPLGLSEWKTKIDKLEH